MLFLLQRVSVPGRVGAPSGGCFPLGNWLFLPENKGKSALHGQLREQSPALALLRKAAKGAGGHWPPLRRGWVEMASNALRYGLVRAGNSGRLRAVPTAGAGGKQRTAESRPYGRCGRGVGDAAPYGGKVLVLSLRGPVRPVAIRFPRPLFNVFK